MEIQRGLKFSNIVFTLYQFPISLLEIQRGYKISNVCIKFI